MNEKIQELLRKSENKTIYGLAKHLGITYQGAEYIVKKKDFQGELNRIKKIAEYFDVKPSELTGKMD